MPVVFNYRNPTPNNEPITFKSIQNDLIHFVDITNDGLIPALGPHKKFTDFWADILARYDKHLSSLKLKDEL